MLQSSNIFNFEENQTKQDNYQNNNQIANQKINFINPPAYLKFQPVSRYVEAAKDEKDNTTYLKIKKGARLKIFGTIEVNEKTYPKI